VTIIEIQRVVISLLLKVCCFAGNAVSDPGENPAMVPHPVWT